MKKVKTGLWWVLAAALLTGVGALLLKGRHTPLIVLGVAVAAMLPFFILYEKQHRPVIRLVLVGVMTALTVAGRLMFAALPGFKPVTALTVLTALYLGPEAGFMTGALSALLSNFFFGQGPWTPFQMLAWGLIGWGAGLLAGPLKGRRVGLAIYGAAAGIVYSLVLDLWTAVWLDGAFLPARYLAALAASAPFTALYAVSNVIFLLALHRPVGRIFTRLQTKYDL